MSDLIQQAGRGTVFVSGAKAYFMLTGVATYVVLPRVLTPEQFGLYSVTVGVASVINAVVMAGTMQAVSKFVSQDPARAYAVQRHAIRLQLFIGGGIALAYYLVSPGVARALNDPRLGPYLQLTAFITLSYSLYAVFLGTLNGQKEFFKQSVLDVCYSTFKMSFIIGLAWAGYAVRGAITGWLGASLAVLALSVITVKARKGEGRIQSKDLLNFQSMILVYTLIINLLHKVDLFLVKMLSSPDPKLSSDMAGYYNAAMTIANVTFQSIVALNFVLFPLISESTSRGDNRTTQAVLSQSVRLGLMLMTLLAVLFSSNAGGLLGLIYRREYVVGAEALQVVAFGMLFFGLLSMLSTVISGSGRPHIAVLLALLTILVDGVLNTILIPRYKLIGAACATTAAMVAGTIAGGVYVMRRFKTLIPAQSLVKILVAGSTTYMISVVLQGAGVPVIVSIGLQAIVYVGLLFMLREIGEPDLRALNRIFRPHG